MKLFAIARKDLLIFVRNRMDVLVEFLIPLAFIIPISLALGSGDGYGINSGDRMIPLPVVNYDQGAQAQVLMTGIGESLQLEYGYDAQLVQLLGLQNDAQCQQAAAASQARNAAATQVAATPAAVQQGEVQARRFATQKSIAQCDEKVSRAMLQRALRTAVLIIPENFSQDIDAGKPAQVTLLYDPGGDSIQMQQIEGVVKGATIRLSLQSQIGSGLNQLSDLVSLAPEDLRSAVQQQVATPAAQSPAGSQNPAIRLSKVFPDNYQLRPTPDTYQQTIPGYTVMFVFFIAAAMGSSLRQESNSGTLRRLLSTPVSRADFLGGKLLATGIIGLVQVLFLFGVGALLFKLGLGSDPLAFFLLCLALVLAAAAIGLAAATIRLRDAALSAILIISALLGGCMFPQDLMPPFMRTLGLFVPHSWALAGFQNLMVRGKGLQDILPQVAALLVFAAIFFAVAARRFNFENQEGA